MDVINKRKNMYILALKKHTHIHIHIYKHFVDNMN